MQLPAGHKHSEAQHTHILTPLGRRAHPYFSTTPRGGGRAWPPSGLALAACAGGTTDPGTAGVSHAATQASATELQGSFAVTQQSGAQFTGALDVIETSAQGLRRRLAGPLAGRTSDSTAVDFEVQLGTAARRHVGRVRGDSLTGTWVETSPGGGAPTASGAFRAARQR